MEASERTYADSHICRLNSACLAFRSLCESFAFGRGSSLFGGVSAFCRCINGQLSAIVGWQAYIGK